MDLLLQGKEDLTDAPFHRLTLGVVLGIIVSYKHYLYVRLGINVTRKKGEGCMKIGNCSGLVQTGLACRCLYSKH